MIFARNNAYFVRFFRNDQHAYTNDKFKYELIDAITKKGGDFEEAFLTKNNGNLHFLGGGTFSDPPPYYFSEPRVHTI